MFLVKDGLRQIKFYTNIYLHMTRKYLQFRIQEFILIEIYTQIINIFKN